MTLLRCLIVAVLAVAVARSLRTLLADRRRPVRRVAWMLLLAPYFTPVLLTGYAYANFSLSLIHHPVINIIFYSALLWWKFTPIAAVILHFTPSPISAEAIHCHRLGWGSALRIEALNGSSRREEAPFKFGIVRASSRRLLPFRERAWPSRLVSQFEFCLFLLRAGCARGPVAAFAVVFLCTFAEFEMASLMVVKSWTVALFDAHAGGLALSESLRRMTGPLLCEAAAITTAFVTLGRSQVMPAQRSPDTRSRHWFAWCHLLLALVFVLLIPAAMVLWGTLRGFGLLLENFVLSREILASLLSAAGASVLAGLAAWGLGAAARVPQTSKSADGRPSFGSRVSKPANASHSRRPADLEIGDTAGLETCGTPVLPAPAQVAIKYAGRLGQVGCKLILVAAVFAGLLGPLVLALAVLAAVQLPGLIALRDTPAPLIFTLGLVLLPMALVLQRVLELTGHRSALHLTRLMKKSRAVRDLTWRLSTSGKFWAMTLLFVWAYWDLTASSILAPIGMTPVTVRLYNLMHYGQIAALSAMTCAAFAAPILILLVALGTRRWWAPP